MHFVNITNKPIQCLQYLQVNKQRTSSYDLNPFRSYVRPRPTLRFSCSALMSEDVQHVFVAPAPLSEPVRRFSSCSTDFGQQIAQVVLFLFLGCEQVIVRCIREVVLVGKWQG